MSSESRNIQDENVFKILVATDIHLGVHEKDPVRGKCFVFQICFSIVFKICFVFSKAMIRS